MIILVLADNIFNMFIENDNYKIINILKRLLFIYEKLLKEIKFKYFHKYKIIIEIIKKKQKQNFCFSLKKESIFNRLYDLKKKDKKLNELARKIEEEENKIYSFSPKLKTKYNPIFSYYFYCSNSPTTRNNLLPNKFLSEENKTSIKYSTSSKCLSEKKNKKKLKERNINKQKSNDNIKQYSIFNIPNYYSNNIDKNIIKNNFRNINHNINNNKSKINSRNSIQNTFNKSITENLSLLFSSRLHKEEQKNELTKDKIKNKKKSQNSSSSITNEKVTNYITLSGTEHLSTLNLDNKSKNDKKKSYSNDYNEKNKIKKNNSQSINNQHNPFIKNTYFFDISKDNKLKNKNSRNNHKILNNYFDSQEDFSKKLSLQNSKSKTTTIIIEGLNTGYSTIKNNTIKSKEIEINYNIVNENSKDNKNRENDKKISINNSNSNNMITIQTISDSKLFDIASLYVRTDESLEKFRFLNKIKKANQQKGILKILNKNIKK